MTHTLFRPLPEGPTLEGVSLRRPGPAVLTAFLAVSIAVAGAYAATASYARKQTASGVLVPSAGIARVNAPRAGVITALYVANGSSVVAGAPLFMLDSRQDLADGGTLDGRVGEALDRQAALLRGQVADETLRAGQERRQLDDHLISLQAERRAVASQKAILEARAKTAQARFDAVADLRRRGLITETEYRNREDAWLVLRQEQAALDQHLAGLDDETRQAESRRLQLPADSADRMAKLDSGLAEVAQRRAEASVLGSVVVRAPVAGRVSALQASPGQRLDPAKPVLALLPPGSDLRAELFVPSRAIGAVRRGQTVRLMYDAFPFQRFGAYQGVVTQVSETMLAPDEVAGPVRPAEPSYRVAVRLERATVRAFGRDIALQPDMTVRADVQLERRTLLAWMFAPMLGLNRSL
jgi:membrane fusion protein